jgi:tetratricopeptide (TPR) repeat protein
VVRKILENARAKGPQEVPTPNRAIRMLAHIRNSRVFPVVLLQALVLGALLFLGFGVWHAVRAQRKLVDLATAAEPHEEARLLVSLVRGGDVKQAEARLREMVGLHPTYPDLRHHLATLLQSQGKLEEARDHWKAALESNPDYADARIELGHLLLMLGPAEEAVEHFRHVTLRKPAFADAHVGLAQALLRCGRAAEAVTPLQTALEINPSLREATELLAKCRTDAAGPKLGTS